MELKLTTTTAHAAPLEQTLTLSPDAQGVESLGVKLALDPAEVPGGSEGVGGHCEMLPREVLDNELPVVHGLPSLSRSG